MNVSISILGVDDDDGGALIGEAIWDAIPNVGDIFHEAGVDYEIQTRQWFMPYHVHLEVIPIEE